LSVFVKDVDGQALVHLVDEHEHVAVLFYTQLDKTTKKVLVLELYCTVSMYSYTYILPYHGLQTCFSNFHSFAKS
jgi:hypothetical protein